MEPERLSTLYILSLERLQTQGDEFGSLLDPYALEFSLF